MTRGRGGSGAKVSVNPLRYVNYLKRYSSNIQRPSNLRETDIVFL